MRVFISPEKYARMLGVHIGENCDIITRNFGAEPYLISIGNEVQIASGVTFYTHGGSWVLWLDDHTTDIFGKISIHDKTYIGGNAIILPGIIIGSNVIVAAGSVVTKSIPDGVIVAGNPARIIGKTSDFKKNMSNLSVGTGIYPYEKKKSLLLSLSEDRFIRKSFLKET